MSLNSTMSAVSTDPPGPALLLVLGDSAAVHQIAPSLQSAGVTTISAASGHDALERVTDLAPDLVAVGRAETREQAVGDVIRQLRARPGKRPQLVVIGHPDLDWKMPPGAAITAPGAGRTTFRPTWLSPSWSVTSGRSSASRPRRRPSPHGVRRYRSSVWTRRSTGSCSAPNSPHDRGCWPRLAWLSWGGSTICWGAQAEEAVAAAFDELFAQDTQVLEQARLTLRITALSALSMAFAVRLAETWSAVYFSALCAIGFWGLVAAAVLGPLDDHWGRNFRSGNPF